MNRGFAAAHSFASQPPECLRAPQSPCHSRGAGATLEPMRSRRRWLLAAFLLASLLAVLWLARWRILAAAGAFLVDAAPAHPADLILLLNGDLDTRPAAAASLWKQNLAPRIAIARSESSRAVQLGLVPNVTDLAVEMLLRDGVPREAISELPFPGGVTSTFDEARALKEWLRVHPAPRILVVTNAIHTRRARWIFSRELKDAGVQLAFYAVPDRRYRLEQWWENEHGFLGVYNEYLKLLYYRLRY
ncbi:MAG: YdcF family protein [Bryobacteraceae bacterium]